jgi:hypothetical protein
MLLQQNGILFFVILVVQSTSEQYITAFVALAEIT